MYRKRKNRFVKFQKKIKLKLIIVLCCIALVFALLFFWKYQNKVDILSQEVAVNVKTTQLESDINGGDSKQGTADLLAFETENVAQKTEHFIYVNLLSHIKSTVAVSKNYGVEEQPENIETVRNQTASRQLALSTDISASSVLPEEILDSSTVVQDTNVKVLAEHIYLKSRTESSILNPLQTYKGVISGGDTASVILSAWLSAVDIQSLVETCQPVFPLSRIRAGNAYTIISDFQGISCFEYEISDIKKLIVERKDNAFAARLEEIEYEIDLTRVESGIDSNLFEAVANAGEGPNLAIALADIFGWEINFIKDLRKGDSFQILVEKRFINGEFKGYGPILAATFANQGKNFEGYCFFDEQGRANYYNKDGESLKKAFLKAPLSFTRISSGYNLKRLHPIFKTVRAHPGIDYAAPTGTPIKAIGNGIVQSAGWMSGGGNTIVLKHSNGYETSYMHLSRFAKGLKKGKNVSQGEIIGYVGSTGNSTGPHLDFRIRKNGKHINPSTMPSPRAEPLKSNKKADFKKQVGIYEAQLRGKMGLH